MQKPWTVAIPFPRQHRHRIEEAARAEGLSPGPWLRSLALRYLMEPAPPEYVHDKVEGVRRRLKKGA